MVLLVILMAIPLCASVHIRSTRNTEFCYLVDYMLYLLVVIINTTIG